MEVEGALLVVAGDRKDFLEHGLQAHVGPLAGRLVRLQEVHIRIELELDQIGRNDDLLDFPKVLSVRHKFRFAR
jgi:hypothetical protein